MRTSKVDLNPTDEEESIDDIEARAKNLAEAAERTLIPTDELSPSSETSIHEVVCDGSIFPPCDLGTHDVRTLSCCLFAQYNGYLEEASDVFQETTCLKPETEKEGLTPDFKMIREWVIEQLRQNPNMAKCDTLVVISDTRSWKT